jgi:hypothetical protein
LWEKIPVATAEVGVPRDRPKLFMSYVIWTVKGVGRRPKGKKIHKKSELDSISKEMMP